MFGLEAVQAAVGKVANTPVYETGRLGHVQPAHIHLCPLRDDIAVPKITASRLPFKKIIHRVEGATPIAAGQKHIFSSILLRGENPVGVRVCAEAQGYNDFLFHGVPAEAVYTVGPYHHEVGRVRCRYYFKNFTSNGLIILLKLTGCDLIGHRRRGRCQNFPRDLLGHAQEAPPENHGQDHYSSSAHHDHGILI
ncbi:MAG: hypothetical protein BWY09_02865 [Candidatus Hydrogenedentes bacterium ADurb.Bin179]|nr:MAG: hypothetical protein BWY09_02865 [Candidatus Hydrogenedentes bacterium ADurb.Bin179]